MNESVNTVTIKMISTTNFEIILIELPNSTYKIAYELDGRSTISESISDYSMATYLFETKLTELDNLF